MGGFILYFVNYMTGILTSKSQDNSSWDIEERECVGETLRKFRE